MRCFLITCCLLLAVLHERSFAQAGDASPEMKAAASALQSRLDAQLGKLTKVRETIAAEKPELAAEMERTAALLRERQREYDVARSAREAVRSQLENADTQLRLWRSERTYLDGLLVDFRKNYETALPLARLGAEQELLKKSANLEGDAGTLAMLELAARAIERIGQTTGPDVFEGKALNPEGELIEGRFAVAGPVTWFLGKQGKTAGLVDANRELVPEVLPGTADADRIQKLLQGERGAAPTFDPTLGTAIALEEVDESLLDHIRKGGVWIYPILLLALVALVAAIRKWLEIVKLKDIQPSLVQQVIDTVNAGDLQQAKAGINDLSHPAAEILRTGIDQHELPHELLDERLFQRFTELLPGLQRGLTFIGIAAATAPLLGLLGTVTGMINTFQKITVYGTGDAKPLAGGISEALVTTEFGLIVAIPSLIIHALLSRKIAAIRSKMEMTSLAFVNGMSAVPQPAIHND